MSNKILPICEKRLPPQYEAVALKNVQNSVLLANHRGLFHLLQNTFFEQRVAKVLQKRLPEKCQVPKPA